MDQGAIDLLLAAAEKAGTDERAVMEVITELQRQAAVEDSAPLWYALAYAWYLHPGRREDVAIASRVDELLHKVVATLPDDYLSLLYLGHNSYDFGRYADAKVYFEKAKRVAPKDYIGLKAYEMVTCCDLMVGGVSGAIDALREFAEEASRGYSPDDVWPRELAAALQKTVITGVTPVQFEEAKRWADRLDDIGSLNGWLATLMLEARSENI